MINDLLVNGLNFQFYKMDLQLFADDTDKTEKATPRRKEQARKKGQTLHSPEISGAIVLAVAFIAFKLLGGFTYENIVQFTRAVFSEYAIVNDFFSYPFLSKFSIEVGILLLKTAVPIMMILLVAGLAINYAQVGFIFTTETITFNIERIINPLNGLKKMFSARSIAELVKSIVKIIIVSAVLYIYIKDQFSKIFEIMGLNVLETGKYFADLIFNVGIRISITLIILGLFDYLFQWWQYEKELMMSKKELKDEYKETEGNPQIKSRIREQQRAISMRRMMQDVPKADVVITNPTHFAVAVKYDLEKSPAPVVLAKGQDYLAKRIKDIAKENNVEIVENKPLARALYSTVDVGESIPQELYQAVAEVLAFVYSLKDKK